MRTLSQWLRKILNEASQAQAPMPGDHDGDMDRMANVLMKEIAHELVQDHATRREVDGLRLKKPGMFRWPRK